MCLACSSSGKVPVLPLKFDNTCRFFGEGLATTLDDSQTLRMDREFPCLRCTLFMTPASLAEAFRSTVATQCLSWPLPLKPWESPLSLCCTVFIAPDFSVFEHVLCTTTWCSLHVNLMFSRVCLVPFGATLHVARGWKACGPPMYGQSERVAR